MKPTTDEQFIQAMLHQLQEYEADSGHQVDIAMGFALSVMHQNLGPNAPAYLVGISRQVIKDEVAKTKAANDPRIDEPGGTSIN